MHVRNASFTIVALALSLLTGCRQLAHINPTADRVVEVHYAPRENLEALDDQLLRSAQASVDVCAFTFTDRKLGAALIAVARRGVKVRIYLDQGQTHSELTREDDRDKRTGNEGIEEGGSEQNFSGVLDSLSATPNVQILVKHSHSLMHLKSYLIDQKILRSGSANFSPTGEKRQDNDLLLTRDSVAVERFRLNFESLWSRGDNEAPHPATP